MRLFTALYTAPKNKSPRSPHKGKVPFRMLLPLELRKTVSSKSDRTTEAACLQEMAVMFACLKKNEFDQTPCINEVNAFQGCYKDFREINAITREQDKKGVLTPGEKKLTYRQVNKLLQAFPPIRDNPPKP